MYDIITVGSAVVDAFVDTGIPEIHKKMCYDVGTKIAVKNISFSKPFTDKTFETITAYTLDICEESGIKESKPKIIRNKIIKPEKCNNLFSLIFRNKLFNCK